jgi:uncharacterized protein YndB with AHSA1/START domain
MEYVRREVDIEAPPEEVWEALATEAGREAWLEPDPERELEVESAQAPGRLVWWWWKGEEQPRKVEVQVIARPAGTRVIVTETEPVLPDSAPTFPLARLRAAFDRTLVAA